MHKSVAPLYERNHFRFRPTTYSLNPDSLGVSHACTRKSLLLSHLFART
jgi:hypothetical protein